ncbi:MAG TPA: DUF5642 family protein [Mycobacterium sp.]|nr:DUF5642 family protein [Mycobacterium sp.]
MPVRKGWVVSSVVVAGCAAGLVGCGSGHKPIDTSKLFEVESKLGPDFKTNTKGPTEVDPKMLGPQKLPPGVTFDPPDCGDYVANNGRPPKGIRGKMSLLSADGAGNRFVVVAIQADKDVSFDTEAAEKCKHVSFEAGKLTGYVDEVDAPHIDGAETVGSKSEIEVANPDGQQHSVESYFYSAYLGDWLVSVTARPLPVRGQPLTMVDADRARQLLTDSVAALRG